jgi:hypothetical protein
MDDQNEVVAFQTNSEPTSVSTGAAGGVGSPETKSLSMQEIAQGIMGTGTAKGAALGALFSELLKQTGQPGGVVQPMNMSQYAIPGRDTTVAAPRFVPYSEYGARDVPAMSEEMMRSFGAPTGLGSLMPMSQYSAMPTMASRAPMTFSSVGSGRSAMPTLNITPRSTKEISPLTGALLGGALGYLVTPESAASNAGSRAMGDLYGATVSGLGKFGEKLVDKAGNFIGNLFSGSGNNTSANNDPYTYVPSYNEDYDTPSNTIFGGGMGSNSFYQPNNSYTYQPTFSGGSQTGSFYNPSFVDPDISYGYVNNDTSGYYKDGGMAVPLMAEGGMAEPSFYTYGTVVDPMQMLSGAQNTGMAQGGMAQGGLSVPTVEGRHDYRAGSRVMGEGDGQSDDIPAMLADGEYVFDADTVAQLGNGSSKAGSDMLDKFREEIRAHKRSAPVNKIPPASKSPLQYLKQAQSRSKKNG